MSNDAYYVGGVTNEELRKRALKGEPVNELYAFFIRQSSAAYRNPKSEMWDTPLITSTRIEKDGVVQYDDKQIERPIDQRTYTRRLTDQVVDYVQQKHDKPFFAWVGYDKPHLPNFASDDFAGKSRAGRVGDAIVELDYSVGRVLDALRKSGQDKNTIVVFVSDNGPWLWYPDQVGSAGIFRDGKFSTYEGGSRVPAIFWQPGTIQPAVVDGLGATYDLMPTFAAMAGATVPDVKLDGIDLVDTLKGKTESPRHTLPYYLGGKLMAWREDDWKLNLYESTGRFGGHSGKLEKPTLYNLGRDPGEQFDQAANEPEIVQRLQHSADAFEQSITPVEPGFDKVLKTLAKQ